MSDVLRTLALVLSLSLAFTVSATAQDPPRASTEIRVWHTLQGAHRAEFEYLVAQFNREAHEQARGMTVVLQAYNDTAALQRAAATRSAALRPHLVQLPDTHTPDALGASAHQRQQILPLYQLLAAQPEARALPDSAWFLPQTTSFVHDARGRLLAFPYMAEIPVMFINRNVYQQAGLDVRQPARTWAQLQDELMALRASGTLCPLLTSQQVSVHFENLAAVNHKLFVQPDNGLGATGPTAATSAALHFDTLAMRHLSLMVSWKRAALLTHHSPGHEASVRFAQGDCGVLMAGSSALAELRQNPALDLGVASLPYYAQESDRARAPFVSGSALWVLAGHARTENAATTAFLTWLAKPVAAARWHQRTGFLPLTRAAFLAANVSFYQRLPGAHQIIDTLRATPATSRGFRLRDYPAIKAVLNQSFEDAMAGNTPPVQVLNEARARIGAIK